MPETGSSSARALGILRYSAKEKRKQPGLGKCYTEIQPGFGFGTLNIFSSKMRTEFPQESRSSNPKTQSDDPTLRSQSVDFIDGSCVESSRTFMKLNQEIQRQWNQRRNYLDEGEFVKGRSPRMDAASLSAPLSEFTFRGDLPMTHRGIGWSMTRQQYSERNIIIGVNGKESRESPTDKLTEHRQEAVGKNLVSDIESNVGFSRKSLGVVPLTWDDQLVQPSVKVLVPRSSLAAGNLSLNKCETQPVVFLTAQQPHVKPMSLTGLRINGKENCIPKMLLKRNGKAVKKKQTSIPHALFLDVPNGDGKSEEISSESVKSIGPSIHKPSEDFPLSLMRERVPKPRSLMRSHSCHANRMEMMVVGSALSRMGEMEHTRGTGGREPLKRGHKPGTGSTKETCARKVSLINIVSPVKTKQQTKEDSKETARLSSEAWKQKSASEAKQKYSPVCDEIQPQITSSNLGTTSDLQPRRMNMLANTFGGVEGKNVSLQKISTISVTPPPSRAVTPDGRKSLPTSAGKPFSRCDMGSLKIAFHIPTGDKVGDMAEGESKSTENEEALGDLDTP